MKIKHITVKEAGEMLGVTPSHIWTLISKKQLKAINISSSGRIGVPQSLRVEVDSIYKFIKEREVDDSGF